MLHYRVQSGCGIKRAFKTSASSSENLLKPDPPRRRKTAAVTLAYSFEISCAADSASSSMQQPPQLRVVAIERLVTNLPLKFAFLERLTFLNCTQNNGSNQGWYHKHSLTSHSWQRCSPLALRLLICCNDQPTFVFGAVNGLRIISGVFRSFSAENRLVIFGFLPKKLGNFRRIWWKRKYLSNSCCRVDIWSCNWQEPSGFQPACHSRPVWQLTV